MGGEVCFGTQVPVEEVALDWATLARAPVCPCAFSVAAGGTGGGRDGGRMLGAGGVPKF